MTLVRRQNRVQTTWLIGSNQDEQFNVVFKKNIMPNFLYFIIIIVP